MKILFLINEMGRGGAERVVSYLLTHLPTISPELIPVLYMLEESEIAYPIPDNIEIVTGSKFHSSNLLKFIKIPLLALRLKRFIKKNNIETVLSFLSRANYTNIIASYFGSKNNCIISERNTASLIYKSQKISDIINRFLIHKLYPLSHKIIAVSKGVQRDLVENFNLPEEKVSVIYNPYDIDLIKQNSLEKIEHRWLGNPAYKSVITVGHLEKSKNHALLIKAFKIVADKLSNARLIIIGEGSERMKLEKLGAELNLDDKIDFTGESKNPFPYVSRADLFVLSSDTEGFPNVLAEAMICGCPAISTDCKSGPNEIIRNRHNGLLVPVGDDAPLSDAIIEVFEDDKLRNKVIQNAHASVKNLGLSNIIQQYYQTLIESQ